mmetsp:Transcript_6596/g.16444  ORF Transcript_6596/g.16444 Transcript_6596/m.16444 type:complete len:114 (-) Transcript_6596:165-506(-)
MKYLVHSGAEQASRNSSNLIGEKGTDHQTDRMVRSFLESSAQSAVSPQPKSLRRQNSHHEKSQSFFFKKKASQQQQKQQQQQQHRNRNRNRNRNRKPVSFPAGFGIVLCRPNL